MLADLHHDAVSVRRFLPRMPLMMPRERAGHFDAHLCRLRESRRLCALHVCPRATAITRATSAEAAYRIGERHVRRQNRLLIGPVPPGHNAVRLPNMPISPRKPEGSMSEPPWSAPVSTRHANLHAPAAFRARRNPRAVRRSRRYRSRCDGALVGFYAALAPSVLAQELHEPDHAVAGALFFGLANVLAGSIVYILCGTIT